MFGKYKNVEQRTDDDIMDEAAGRARITMAAESKARKKAQAEALARQNAAMQARLANVQAATDFDINDEAAGRMRAKMAAQSRKRREAEKQLRERKNAEMQERLRKTAQRTDDDITDEATGRARVEWAAASATRKAEQQRMLTRRNREMMARITSARPKFEHGISRSEPLSPEQVVAAGDEALSTLEKVRQQLRQARLEAETGLTVDQLHMRKTLKDRSRKTPVTALAVQPSSPENYVRSAGRWHKELFRLDS